MLSDKLVTDVASAFLAQHGFTLFLSLILSRTYSLVLDLIKAQEDLAILKTKVGLAYLPTSEMTHSLTHVFGVFFSPAFSRL